MPQRTGTIKRACLQCKKEFYPWHPLEENTGKFCSHSCRTIYYNKLGIMGNKRDFLFIPCETCGKIFKVSRRHAERYNTRFCSIKCRGIAQSKYQMRERNACWKGTPELKCENCGKPFLAYSREAGRIQRFCSRSCYLAHANKINSLLWKDPNFVHKMMVSQRRKPTLPERKLAQILNKYFPNQWKYTGNGSLCIEGYCPDFTNCDGRKDLIEVFGDYWHSPERLGDDWRRSELGRIMAYNSLGYRCLVIWQHELKELSEEQIIDRIHIFQKEVKNGTRNNTKTRK